MIVGKEKSENTEGINVIIGVAIISLCLLNTSRKACNRSVEQMKELVKSLTIDKNITYVH